ncbi:MAG: CPBP family intramembrane metalloprotease [Oscillospiraceae bacterium]|nr:CPBP family intramembrane metalloprotease [Oscillospiraceae bacterium]
MKITDRKNERFFAVMTYVIFFVEIGICGLVMLLGLPEKVLNTIELIVSAPMAWSSFFVLMLWAKKLYPEMTRKEFIKNAFSDKLSIKWIIISVCISFAVYIVSLGILITVSGKSIGQLFNKEFALNPLMFLLVLVSGPLGEELGWRGYYLTSKAKRYSVLKASLITGLVWSFWHLPLWFLRGGNGIDLLIYILAFIVQTTSQTVVFGYIYTKHRNLVYTILIHTFDNFLAGTLVVDATSRMASAFYIIQAAVYVIAALVTILIYKKSEITKIQPE